MAESWQKAFGRYLRTLRLRKGLSLQEVCSLSQAFAQTIEKGYLSRCENGYQGPSFAKIIPLSRIYGVPADVLLERLELDMELEKVGAPETEGMCFSELNDAAKLAIVEGSTWHAYAFARAATVRSSIDPRRPLFGTGQEQIETAHMSCGTAALGLGRTAFALHEFRHVASTGSLGDRMLAVLETRLSLARRMRGELEEARVHADNAVGIAEASNEDEFLGFVYSNKASQSYSERKLSVSADFYKKAHQAFSETDQESECARCLHNLGQVFFEQSRDRAARRALQSAERLDRPAGRLRGVANGKILLGDIESRAGNYATAKTHWRDAATIAKQQKDKILRFRAEFRLFRLAVDSDEVRVARSIGRRLVRLSNWIPKNTPELGEFQRLNDRT